MSWSPGSTAVGDLHLLHRQFGLAFLARDDQRHADPVISQNRLADLLARPFAGPEDVVDPLRLEFGDGGRADHATISDDADVADAEARSQPFDHGEQHGDIGRVAWPQEGG